MGAQTTILVLAANPSDQQSLALDREVREIDARLRASAHRDAFRIEQARAVQARDLSTCLLRYKPAIVHFSGHGSDEGELLLEDASGDAKPVTREIIGDLFRICGESIQCVVLNACYSQAQAEVLAQHVACVVGMTKKVPDATAIAFAGAFYEALGYAQDVQRAFELGCLAIGLTGGEGPDIPKLLVRKGADARGIKLVPRVASGSPQGSGGQGAAPDNEPLDEKLEKLVGSVAEMLKAAPDIARILAKKLNVSANQGDLARALALDLVRSREAKDVAKALNHLDHDLEKSNAKPHDREVVRRLLWQILPFAVDVLKLVVQGRETVGREAGSVELPLRSETIAEVVLAGIDDRCCRFAPAGKGLPVGAALVRVPAAVDAPVFINGAHLAELVTRQLAAKWDLGDACSTDAELRSAVDGALHFHAHEVPEDERLPYYFLFVDAELRARWQDGDARPPGEGDLWALVRTALGTALPSLRLVKLKGGNLRDETVLAMHIKTICERLSR